MKRIIIIIAALTLLSCSKDKSTDISCSNCLFKVEVRTGTENIEVLYPERSMRFAWGIPDNVSDVCRYMDTTNSKLGTATYIGRICE